MDLLKTLKALNGSWIGSGEGMYPTMDSFYYRDEITFTSIAQESVVHFEQKTWVANEENLKHWESGFISVIGNDKLKLYTCHHNGRVEILDGRIKNFEKRNDVLVISFSSQSIHNETKLTDLIKSERTITIGRDNLEYQLSMATNEVTDLKVHLKSKLQRA